MPAAKPSFPTLQRGKPLADLAAGWPMYEGSGSKAYDLSGKDNHASLSASGASWSGGQSGWCLSLSGTSSYLSLPYAAFSPLKQMTIAFWVYPTSTLGSSDAYYWNSGTQLFMRTAFASLAHIRAVILTSGGNPVLDITPTGISAFAWNHLALTYDGTTLAVWVNGSVIGSTTTSGNLDWVNFNTQLVKLGSDDGGATNFPGSFDGPVLYGRALSRPEMAVLVADSWQMYRRRSWRLKAGGAPANFANVWLLRA